MVRKKSLTIEKKNRLKNRPFCKFYRVKKEEQQRKTKRRI